MRFELLCCAYLPPMRAAKGAERIIAPASRQDSIFSFANLKLTPFGHKRQRKIDPPEEVFPAGDKMRRTYHVAGGRKGNADVGSVRIHTDSRSLLAEFMGIGRVNPGLICPLFIGIKCPLIIGMGGWCDRPGFVA